MIWDLINPAKTFVYTKCAVKLVVLITLSNSAMSIHVWKSGPTLVGKRWLGINTGKFRTHFSNFMFYFVILWFTSELLRSWSLTLLNRLFPTFASFLWLMRRVGVGDENRLRLSNHSFGHLATRHARNKKSFCKIHREGYFFLHLLICMHKCTS